MLDRILARLGGARADPARLLQEAEEAYERGELEVSRRLCEAALARQPGARAQCLMAAIAADAGRTEEGLEWTRRAQASDPSAAGPHYVAGRLWQGAGRLADAEASYRRAIALQPGHARAYNNLGGVLHMQGNLDGALAAYRKALDLEPGLAQANQNYASIVRDTGVLERAAQGYRRQTLANPRDALAFNDLGNTLRELGRHDEALAAYAQALAIEPELAEAHFSRAFVLLLRGEYAEGWREYEWRWRIPAFNGPARRFAQPIWDGARTGGAILLHAEQGLGDTLQFARYAAPVAARCASVVLECQPELRSLMEGVPGVARVVARGEPLPAFDAHAPLMSLPARFGSTLENLPWGGPYVRAEPQRIERWRSVLDADAASLGTVRLRVGLVWAGRPQQWDDRKRSISLAAMAPLSRAAGTIFYSLQVGAAAAQASAPPSGMRLIDHAARIADFSDTAALATLLDLVITIDTSVAHLGGAMGLPTWVLVAHAPDWRYHLARADNPWYPSMRLFRQARDGDWADAIEAVADALVQRAGLRG
ncbi:MAG TPA: tetratricopeptide repeat protein [Burkholderiales bacterium]|jgi:tetratricopeptide (TPR) repeat protein|nr:tetratricopeptide repeat protein [Burkholderiales bacterium]